MDKVVIERWKEYIKIIISFMTSVYGPPILKTEVQNKSREVIPQGQITIKK